MLTRGLGWIAVCALAVVVLSCARETPSPGNDLLRHVPAATPYLFVNSRHLPQNLRDRLGDQYALQLSVQRDALRRLRSEIDATPDALPPSREQQALFDVLDATLAEFEGRETAAQLRELGIEPVTRAVFYGLGLLPAMRIEIADGARLDAMLDRIEQRAGVRSSRGMLEGQGYRRVDLGSVDLVLAVSERLLVAGLLADPLFDDDLPLLLGHRVPSDNMASDGAISRLIEQHAFTGYGEGYIRLDRISAVLQGRAPEQDARALRALGIEPAPVTPGCAALTAQLVDNAPRMVIGITEASERRIRVRGVWETSAVVAGYLNKLAAPVPGIGAAHEGLVSLGLGLDLPQLRNAIDALLRLLIDAGQDCEWVDPEQLRAAMPRLNLALGPMTAGIKGFNLRIDDLQLAPETLQPAALSAGLLAAIDDPRGLVALGAMFNPALASLELPDDGSLVALPETPGLEDSGPPLNLALRERALVIVAGDDAELARSMLDAAPATPAPLLALDYGVRRLVEELGPALERAAGDMEAGGEPELAAEMREQLASLRLQAGMFERLRTGVYAGDAGLVMDQVMELR